MTRSATLVLQPAENELDVLPAPVRLFRPRLGRHIVDRPRLHALLDAGGSSRLTLVSAPPGAGKTVALVTWLAARPEREPVAWLSLSDRDDNPRTFWHRIAVAVATGRGTAVPADEASDAELIATFFGAMEAEPPLLLVLDDFHLVRSPELLGPFAQLLSIAPERLRVVIATRSDPDLELHRLRLTGDLAEIRAGDLAFTQAEAEEFFAAAGVPLGTTHVETLVRRAEGWAAGLRFAALSLGGSGDVEPFVSAFEESDRASADYLVHEVLAHQDETTRRFLLTTAMCDRICGALADALTGCTDGERTLVELERNNVFLSREPGGQWFRYHGLFAELLRAEAVYELGDEVRMIHQAAATWLAGEGCALEALHHAIAAADVDLGSELLGGLWAQVVGEGQVDVAAQLVNRLDPDAVRTDPQLSLLAAWERLAAGDLVEADGWLAIAATDARILRDGDLRRYELGRRIVLLTRARMIGDLAEIETAATELEAPESLVLSTRQTERRRALVLCARGAVATWRGELEEAKTTLEEALALARSLSLYDVEFDATSMLALIDAVQGELKAAVRRATAAAAFADRNRARWGTSAHLIPAHAALAICAFEWGDAEGGESSLAAARSVADASGDRAGRALAIAVGAWSIGRAGPEAADAVRICTAAMSRGAARHPVLPLLRAPLRIVRSRLELAAGNLDAADAALALGDDHRDGELLVAAARIALARDDVEVVTALLEPVLSGDVKVVFGRARVEAAVLQALASTRLGDAERGRVWIEHALDLAEPNGMRGPFLDAIPGVAEPLRLAIRRGTAHRWLISGLLAVADGRAGAGATMPHELLEPLSEREEVVLRYLPTLMSNPEIAAELFVSVNTIKTHLKSIYRKLGVSHRREAVRRGRELRLIA
jgi:LuxR family transcriptional regulator, maltose regulon positive regulatory protein